MAQGRIWPWTEPQGTGCCVRAAAQHSGSRQQPSLSALPHPNRIYIRVSKAMDYSSEGSCLLHNSAHQLCLRLLTCKQSCCWLQTAPSMAELVSGGLSIKKNPSPGAQGTMQVFSVHCCTLSSSCWGGWSRIEELCGGYRMLPC